MDAIRKLSLMPAQRPEKSVESAHRKSRVQEGADADVIVFYPQTADDRATYQAPREPSVGMQFVIVGGTMLSDQGEWIRIPFPAYPSAGRTAPAPLDRLISSILSLHTRRLPP